MLKVFKKAEKLYKVAIILVDLILINLAYILAFFIKFDWTLPSRNFDAYLSASPFITIVALIYLDLFGLLKFYRRNLQEIAVSIFKVVFILAVTTVTITYFLQGYSFPRSVLVIAPVIQVVLLYIWKAIIFYIKRITAKDLKLMVIGERSELESIILKVEHTLRRAKMNIRYVIPADEIQKAFTRIKDCDEVFISDNVTDDRKMKIITQCLAEKKVVYIVPKLFEISLSKARMIQFEDIPAFMIDKLELTVEQKFFKRIFDIVISIFGLIITLPLTIVIAFFIKITSPGPIIYKQTRLTIGNKQFEVLKFRTMFEGSEDNTGPVLSTENDPRTTKVGKVLRRFRIDELPQLINVLKGEMSFVGPRPERPFFVEQLSRDIPEYTHRYLVKAGITGYAQILGNYDTTPEDKLRYDLMYIKNYSLLLDIKLILQTVRVIISKEKGSEANIKISKKNLYNLGYTNKGQSLRL